MNRAPVLFLGILTAVIGVLALPLIGSRFAELPGSGALAAIRRAEPVSSDAYRRVIDSREQASAWLDDPRYAKDVGDALFLGGQRVDRRMDTIGVLASAKSYLESGLNGAPADPKAFAEIAWAAALTGDLLRASKALNASYAVGPQMPELALVRNSVGMGMWRWLSPDLRRHLGAEVHRALDAGGEGFVRTLIATGKLDEARLALAGRDRHMAILDSLAAIITGEVPSVPQRGRP